MTTMTIMTQAKNSLNHPVRSGSSSASGFTIIELLVVVSLIALLLGFSVPLVFKIDELSRDRSGINSFGVGVSAARAAAAKTTADNDGILNAEYSGAALLVTPQNELRVVRDVQNSILEPSGFSEYQDVPLMEPIAMPRGMGVVGISRDDASSVALLAPPFAIRFNRFGQLIASTSSNTNDEERRNLVFYDGNYDGAVSTAGRPGGYDPTPYDPDLSNVTSHFNTTRNQYTLPYEAMESAVGVVVYSKADFEDAGGKLPAQKPSLGCKDGTCDSVAEWMFDNGSVLFFSRNTGTIIRTKRQ
jgi:prepilin-type N-terminal cleavage/methylation domain-containing protein